MIPKIPIVVVAFNRPKSLKRILNSIYSAKFPNETAIELIISIDYSGSGECEQIAKSFEWKHGPKKIIIYKENLGLKEHILSCGNIAIENDGAILLEDDCFVSKDFYNYAIQAVDYYKDDPKVAGVSLYSYQFNENAWMPFTPLQDNSDVYFMQVPSSWGQLWTQKQWALFIDYYKNKPGINEKDKLPSNVSHWPETSWKKYFYKYIVEKDLYLVYPKISHSTNFGDQGTHFTQSLSYFQVPISNAINRIYHFIEWQHSNNIYDAYYEILPRCLTAWGFSFNDSFGIDTYLTKQFFAINTDNILTILPSSEVLLKYDISMKPILNNVIYNNYGEGLYMIKRREYTSEERERYVRLILEKHFPRSFNEGLSAGIELNMKTLTYKVGKNIVSIFDYKKLIKRRTKY